MLKTTILCDAYIIDTYRNAKAGTYKAGAITFRGRKKVEVLHWDKAFTSQRDANIFVQKYFQGKGLKEAENEGELLSRNPLMNVRVYA